MIRSRAAVVDAATRLFLREGYAGTTMDEVAALAGLTKRTLYNHYADKEALFTEIVTGAMAEAQAFAGKLPSEFGAGITAVELPEWLHDLGRRLALAVVRPEIIALRRLLIGEARTFPALAAEYFDRAPGRVIEALADGFGQLRAAGLLRGADMRRAAEQFAYLVLGEPLDRALLAGAIPSRSDLVACAREGVETFLARYGASAEAGA